MIVRTNGRTDYTTNCYDLEEEFLPSCNIFAIGLLFVEPCDKMMNTPTTVFLYG